jgi:hypothetical protein
VYNLLKHKNSEDCPHSTNALGFCLESSRGDMPLSLTFLRPRMAQPTLIPVSQSPLYVGSTRELNHQRRRLVSPSYLTMPLFQPSIFAS